MKPSYISRGVIPEEVKQNILVHGLTMPEAQHKYGFRSRQSFKIFFKTHIKLNTGEKVTWMIARLNRGEDK